MRLGFLKGKVMAIAVAVVSLTMVACSGEDGEDGTTGAPGSSSVQSSTFTIADTMWNSGNAVINVPGLTKDIADNGVVSVFFTFDSLGTDTITWNPLPHRFVGNVGGTNQFITLQNTVSIGQVTITARFFDNTPINFNTETNARVVMIPSANMLSGVNHDNYDEMVKVYGIEENE